MTKPDGHLLTVPQRKQLENSVFIEKIADDQMFPACFVPHHFFRYYDSKGRQLGEIAVCFCCDGVAVEGDHVTKVDKHHFLNADYSALEDLVEEMNEPTDIQC